MKFTSAHNYGRILLTICSGTSLFTASALLSPAFAQNPTPPGNISFAVYSNKSAEVFWERATDNDYVLEYEVQVNGEVVESKDSTSYYARTFFSGTDFTVGVTAIDNEGNRSVTETVSFVGGDRSIVEEPIEEPTEQPSFVETPATGSEPSSPTNLRSAIYSRKTVELFWDRVQSATLQYEIFEDSELLDTTNGTSSLLKDLQGGTSYSFSVVAIDADGNRSQASIIEVQTPGATQASQPEPVDPIAPTAPQNAVLVVYSHSNAEIFWERAPAAAAIVNNEIHRDGVLVDETDGTSYYDGDRVAGVTYQYEITAINADGERSPTTVVGESSPTEPVTPEPVTPEPVTPEPVTPEPVTPEPVTPEPVTPEPVTPEPVTPEPVTPISAFTPEPTDIVDVDAFYDEDGYDTVNVIRLDVRTVTTEGVCTIDDLSGCTFDDVLADIDGDDDFKVDIAVHLQGDDLPDDGSISNATMRQRGGTSRTFPQKSFRIKLDSKENLWRNERRLQLNKHPNERARIRNKLAFDLMRELPHLPSLRTQFVNLWIDDGAGPEDYGLFTHVEFAGKEYLVNRGLNDDDRVYKTEYFAFSQGDLDNILVDADGEPLDEDRFESRLSIERGKDHSLVAEMLTAMVDPAQSFESVFDQYFNRNNVLTWYTANMLMYNTDAITHNFFLYNPVGSEKLYFLPWDYDGSFHPDSVLSNSYDPNELAKRLYYGYARGANSEFTKQFLMLPGIHEEIVAVADELRNSYLTDSNISERAERYSAAVAPFLSQSPDLDNNPRYTQNAASEFANYVSSIHDALQNSYNIPMPHKQNDPEIVNDTIHFSWTPAFDVTRTNELSYDLEIADSADFAADSILLNVEGIKDDANLVSHSVDATQLPSSATLYYRVTTRGDSDPMNVWQVSSNTLNGDGVTYFGVVEFVTP